MIIRLIQSEAMIQRKTGERLKEEGGTLELDKSFASDSNVESVA